MKTIKFKELRDKMTPEQRRRLDNRVEHLLACLEMHQRVSQMLARRRKDTEDDLRWNSVRHSPGSIIV